MQLVEPVRIEGYEAVRLRSASAHVDATFVPSAGMVGASLRDRGAELLHRNGGADRYARAGSTTGIPLLHPWANRLEGDRYRVSGTAVRLDPGSGLVQRDEHGPPIHGLLNGSRHWRTLPARGGWALCAEIDFAAHPELLAAFPFPHRLRLDVALRRRALRVRTTLTATGDRPVPVAFGRAFTRICASRACRARAGTSSSRRCAISNSMRAPCLPAPLAPWALRPGRSGARAFDDGYSTSPRARSSCSLAAGAA